MHARIRSNLITGHQNLKEIETYTKAVEQAALAKTAMASVTKAFHKAEVANHDDGLAEIDFNALTLKDQNMQVALPRGLEPPCFRGDRARTHIFSGR
jgi:ribosomal protein L14E/L6E/L27E